MVQTPSLEDVMQAAMDVRLASVFTAMPGRIVSYNAAEQSADVQPIIQGSYIDERGERQVGNFPVIPRVPVVFFGAGSFRMTVPVTVGATCWLMFANCSIDRWLATDAASVDPADDRKHSISDAVAFLGLRAFNHPLQNAPTDRMSVGHDTGVTIEIHSNEVRLGGDDATDPVIRRSDLDDFIQNDFNLHTHLVPFVTSGSATETAVAIAVPASTPPGSSVVKTK